MSSHSSIHADIADAILEHAAAITGLDHDGMAPAAYAAAYASHVAAIRLLAVSHVDPRPDRAFVRELKSRSRHVPGVFVQFTDGAIELVVDAMRRQHRFHLWTREQLLKNEEPDDGIDG